MGAKPYEYFVPFEVDAQSALDKLRQQVFASGEYATADLKPETIDDAVELGDADGTASILDIELITDEPDFACAAPYSGEELAEYFGTNQPTRGDLQTGDGFWDDLERGQARFMPIYDGGQPKELCFVGYSFD
ncbi:MAG: hypothetical protein AAF266_02515 [Planctomycetota bacterium]